MKIAVVTGASSGIGREFVYAVDKIGLDEIWVIARRNAALLLDRSPLTFRKTPAYLHIGNCLRKRNPMSIS